MRLNFVDELNERGQINMELVEPGEMVRFEALFYKEGDDGSEFSVDEGTLGEVIDIDPQRPGVIVRVHGAMNEPGFETKYEDVLVKPTDVVLLVNSEDPRIGNNRVGKKGSMDIGLWDVVRAGVPALAGGNFVSKAKATAALVAWARKALHGESDSAADIASKVYAAIDALEEMSDEQWASELAEQTKARLS